MQDQMDQRYSFQKLIAAIPSVDDRVLVISVLLEQDALDDLHFFLIGSAAGSHVDAAQSVLIVRIAARALFRHMFTV